MVEFCDYLIAFWDGKSKGTLDSISYAKAIDTPVIVHLFIDRD